MGWTSNHNDQKMNYQDIKDYIDGLWTTSNSSKNLFWEAEKTAIRGNTAYTIVHHTNTRENSTQSFIAVTIFHQYKNKNDYGYEFVYKEITEDSGPFYYNCPVSYINQLGGIDGASNDTSRKWRENVLAYVEEEKTIKYHRDNSLPLNINFSGENYTVTYNKNYKKWVINDTNKYISTKYIKPGVLVNIVTM